MFMHMYLVFTRHLHQLVSALCISCRPLLMIVIRNCFCSSLSAPCTISSLRSFGSFCPSEAMPVLEVKRRLCFNDCAVPAEEQDLSVLDPYNLSNETDDNLSVSLVNFKASGNMTWLQKGLELSSRWWVLNHHRIPVLQEILNLIRNQKPKKGAAVRMPKNHKNLLPLQVRGKVLWFQNDSRCVILAVKKGQEALDDFQWFLQELSKDIEDLEEVPEEPVVGVGHKEIRAPIPEDIQDVVNESLQTIRDHPQCLSTVFLQSRSSIRVQRKNDKATKDLRVKDLKRKRAESAEQDNQDIVKRQFDLVVQSAISFLDPQVLAGAASSNQAPADPGNDAQGLS